eukprot:4950256-Pyramimonas_sp.AAC.1
MRTNAKATLLKPGDFPRGPPEPSVPHRPPGNDPGTRGPESRLPRSSREIVVGGSRNHALGISPLVQKH